MDSTSSAEREYASEVTFVSALIQWNMKLSQGKKTNKKLVVGITTKI